MIRSGTETGESGKPSDIESGNHRVENKAFQRLKTTLAQCFAAPDSSYRPMTAAEVIARNKA